jgi:hypothetical protein
MNGSKLTLYCTKFRNKYRLCYVGMDMLKLIRGSCTTPHPPSIICIIFQLGFAHFCQLKMLPQKVKINNRPLPIIWANEGIGCMNNQKHG